MGYEHGQANQRPGRFEVNANVCARYVATFAPTVSEPEPNSLELGAAARCMVTLS